jgi:glycosyltransferase involved in cell wall biosynthesis
VQEGENGHLFQAGNDRELAEHVEAVLGLAPEQYRRMQQASLEAVKVHDIDRTLDTFESLYRGDA